ncbi:DUF3427 domain-containing protein [Lysinibacillus sp. FSL M8-0216]|uniref:HNH endonuclease n=1 Tax=Lysinibacillus sp. FSL M8-0216 TaxID=2921619 RepID=UPI00315A3E88
MKYPFNIGEMYTRKEVKRNVGHSDPEAIGGDWATGYTRFAGCYFIFATISTAGRTGHDYPNILTNNELYWFSKNKHTLNTPSIKDMMDGEHEVFIFTREDSKNPNFVFKGLGYVRDYEDTIPAHIVWGFVENMSNVPFSYRAAERKRFLEGAKREGTITRYERNSRAREACVEYYGHNCQVCGMNFKDTYGNIGEGYIHVHHEVEISMIAQEYEVDPIEDLKPVCPNCHAMIHKRKPAYTIEELRRIKNSLS